MNRASFIAETSPRAAMLVGSRVKFNDKSLVMYMNNLDAKTARKMAEARGTITKLVDENCCDVGWDEAMVLLSGRKITTEFLRDLEDEEA